MTEGYFVAVVVFYAVFCLFPYHINRGSNTARWIYIVLTAVSFILLLGLGFQDMPPPEAIAWVITIPITIFAIVRLFQESSRDWFDKETSK